MIRTYYDKGKDYIDSFWPFVLKCLPVDKTTLTLELIKYEIKKKYGLDIPLYSLSVILTRAKRKGFISQKIRRYVLTEDGIKQLNMFESEREVERRIEELIEDARSFLNKYPGNNLSLDDTRDLVQTFVKEHIEFFEQFINTESTSMPLNIRDEKLRENGALLLAYFTGVERAKPTIFKTLQDIIFGSIISAIIHSKYFAETTKKFERTKVYLDTNFIFSILDLHFGEYDKPAQELFKLMQTDSSFEFRIFDFTIDEMVNVLRNYPKEQYLYVPNIKVRSIFSSLKSRNWSLTDVRELIMNIEPKLFEKGINVEPTNINLNKYEPKRVEYRSTLLKYKPWQGTRGQNHDLAAIEKISELRRGPARRIERSGMFFLTSDMKLSKYDFLEMRHKERATICEIIPDRLLTNIIWLKNPTLIKEIKLDSIIAMYSRDLFIDKDIWRRFYDIVEDLRKKGNIYEKDISILLYDRHIQEVLRTYGPEDLVKIDDGWVLENIKEAKQRMEKAKTQELVKQKVIFEQKLTQSEKEQNEKWNNSILKIKNDFEIKAKKQANVLDIMAKILLILILIGLTIILARPLIKNWIKIEPWVWLITVDFSAILTILGLKWENIFKFELRVKFFNWIYQRKLREWEPKFKKIETEIFGNLNQ
jgi:hypothetical protein